MYAIVTFQEITVSKLLILSYITLQILKEHCAESCNTMQEGASFKPGAFLICQLLGIVAQSHSQSGEFVVLGKSISDLLES